MTRRIFRDLPGFIDAGKGCPAHIGTRDLRIHHPLQDGVQVQILGDAAAGLAQSREALPQGGYLRVSPVCWVQSVTSLAGGQPFSAVPARRTLG